MAQTQASDGFDNASAQDKADMFDASHADPSGYADKNFHSGPDIPTTGVTVTGGNGQHGAGNTGASPR